MKEGDLDSALLIDFDDIYHRLGEYRGVGYALADTLRIIVAARDHLAIQYRQKFVIARAYGDPSAMDGRVFSQFQSLGIEPRVAALTVRSSSTVLLSMDAAELLVEKPDISSFGLIGGDRASLNIIRRMHERMKRVVVVAFSGMSSSDLRAEVSAEHFVAAESFLSPSDAVASPSDDLPRPGFPADHISTLTEDEAKCLRILLAAGRMEIGMGQLHGLLRKVIPRFERAAMMRALGLLSHRGVVKVESRPSTSTFVIMNYGHDFVRQIRLEIENERLRDRDLLPVR